MPGPPPKPPGQRRRRNAGPAETLLPKAGRKGRAPKWPLSKANAAESALWRDLWSTPQAVAWEQHSWTRVVARYVRLTIQAEAPGAMSSLLAEVRQLEDRLGLTPMAMRRLMWKVDDRDELADRRSERTGTAPTARRRVRAVDPAHA